MYWQSFGNVKALRRRLTWWLWVSFVYSKVYFPRAISKGHVDAGKSTLMGHLLFLLGNVSKKVMHK